MAHIYAYGPGKGMKFARDRDMVPHPELDPIDTPDNRQAIYNWFDGEVLKVKYLMQANTTLTFIAISNDGKDRCGFRLGPAILDRLSDLGNRIQLGQILPPEQY